MQARPKPSYFVADNVTLSVPPARHFEHRGSGKHTQEAEGKTNDLVHVGVTDYNLGKYLYTDGVGPCQAVIVRFSDGEFGLYHASSAYTAYVDTSTEEKKEEEIDIFAEFKKDCADRIIDEVFIIEKLSGNKSNREKAPLLAVGFAEHFVDDPNKVKRLQVANYDAVYCDATTGQVIICNKLAVTTQTVTAQSPDQTPVQIATSDNNLNQLTLETGGREKPGHLVPYKQSTEELRQMQKKGDYRQYRIKPPQLTEEDLLEAKKQQIVDKLDKIAKTVKDKSPMKTAICNAKTKLQECKSAEGLDTGLKSLEKEMETANTGQYFNSKKKRAEVIKGIQNLQTELTKMTLATLSQSLIDKLTDKPTLTSGLK